MERNPSQTEEKDTLDIQTEDQSIGYSIGHRRHGYVHNYAISYIKYISVNAYLINIWGNELVEHTGRHEHKGPSGIPKMRGRRCHATRRFQDFPIQLFQLRERERERGEAGRGCGHTRRRETDVEGPRTSTRRGGRTSTQ